MAGWASLPSILRHLRQGGWTHALHIVGLAAAIAVCVVTGQVVRYEIGYNGWVPDARNVWRVESHSNDMTSARAASTTPFAAWSAIRSDIPHAIGTRVDKAKVAVTRDATTTQQTLLQVDRGFFRVFPMPVVAGSLDGWTKQANALVLSQRYASKQFGGADPIGRTVRYVHRGRAQKGRVMAVVADPPANTDLHFEMIGRLPVDVTLTGEAYDLRHDWSYRKPTTYLRFGSDRDAGRVAARLPAIVARHFPQGTRDVGGYRITLSLGRLTQVHLAAPEQRRALVIFGLASLMLLLVAVANSLNLLRARTLQRVSEMKLRRGLGARGGALFRLVMTEILADVLLAAFLGLALAEAALPLIDHIAGLTLTMRYGGMGGALVLLACLVLMLTGGVGFWPAISLSRVRMGATRSRSAGALDDGRAPFVREVLVTFQTLVMTVLAAATLILCAQLWHVRHHDAGFQRDHLVVIRSLADKGLSETKRRALLARLKEVPGVRGVTVGSDAPGGGQLVSENLFALSGDKRASIPLRRVEIAPGYFDLLGARFAAGGEPETSNHLSDDAHPSAVLNMAAVRALHLSSARMAIGHTLEGPHHPRIVAVITDMRFGSPHEKVPPAVYEYAANLPDTPLAVVRTSQSLQQAIPAMHRAWQTLAPDIPWNAQSGRAALADTLQNDLRLAWLMAIGTLLSFMTASIGLWAMTVVRLIRNAREIALRRMLGATPRALTLGLMRGFLRPVLIGSLVAIPVAFLVMRGLLASFDDRFAYAALLLPIAALVSICTGFCTVVGPILYALAVPPSRSLRHE